MFEADQEIEYIRFMAFGSVAIENAFVDQEEEDMIEKEEVRTIHSQRLSLYSQQSFQTNHSSRSRRPSIQSTCTSITEVSERSGTSGRSASEPGSPTSPKTPNSYDS